MKGAHADLSSTAWQEIGVKPYFGLSGITALDTLIFVIRSVAEGLYSTPLTAARIDTQCQY